jgi:hypothetical protein
VRVENSNKLKKVNKGIEKGFHAAGFKTSPSGSAQKLNNQQREYQKWQTAAITENWKI